MNQMRYVEGNTCPVDFPTDASHPIQEGDLLFVHPATGKVWPAADLANQGSLSLNQDAFQQYFAGVALNKAGLQSGEKSFRLVTDPGFVSVATKGRFQFPCIATAFKSGDLVGVAVQTSPSNATPSHTGTGPCCSQCVDAAASASLAIGNAVVGGDAIGQTLKNVVVDIQSTVMNAGIQNQVSGSGSGQ